MLASYLATLAPNIVVKFVDIEYSYYIIIMRRLAVTSMSGYVQTALCAKLLFFETDVSTLRH